MGPGLPRFVVAIGALALGVGLPAGSPRPGSAAAPGLAAGGASTDPGGWPGAPETITSRREAPEAAALPDRQARRVEPPATQRAPAIPGRFARPPDARLAAGNAERPGPRARAHLPRRVASARSPPPRPT